MIDARVKELLAIAMVGEGVLALMYPRRHALLWKVGPRSWREMAEEFARRPGLRAGWPRRRSGSASGWRRGSSRGPPEPRSPARAACLQAR